MAPAEYLPESVEDAPDPAIVPPVAKIKTDGSDSLIGDLYVTLMYDGISQFCLAIGDAATAPAKAREYRAERMIDSGVISGGKSRRVEEVEDIEKIDEDL
jgi:hypothetical protein